MNLKYNTIISKVEASAKWHVLGEGVFESTKHQNLKTILLLACTHGNETVGLDCIDFLIDNFKHEETQFNLRIIITNLDALNLGKRYVDIDMNRLLDVNFPSNITNLLGTSEGKRLSYIAKFLTDFDILIDIHSTIKPSVPFIYCEKTPNHFTYAKHFNVQYIVSPGISLNKNDQDLFTSFDSLADRMGKIGITIEAGSIEDSALENVNLGIESILYSGKTTFQPKTLSIYEKVLAKSDNFAFLNPQIKNFDFVPKGHVFATDDTQEVRAQENSFVIFPKQNIKSRDLCCLLAKDE